MSQEIRKILYATDLGEHTRPAFQMALNMAQRYGAKLVILHSLENLGAINHLFNTYVSAETAEKFHRETHAEISEKIHQRIAGFCQDILGESAEESTWVDRVVVLEDSAEVAILREAEHSQVDMIVLGTRTHSRLSEMLLGSTAHKVIQLAKVPVLVVPLN